MEGVTTSRPDGPRQVTTSPPAITGQVTTAQVTKKAAPSKGAEQVTTSLPAATGQVTTTQVTNKAAPSKVAEQVTTSPPATTGQVTTAQATNKRPRVVPPWQDSGNELDQVLSEVFGDTGPNHYSLLTQSNEYAELKDRAKGSPLYKFLEPATEQVFHAGKYPEQDYITAVKMIAKRMAEMHHDHQGHNQMDAGNDDGDMGYNPVHDDGDMGYNPVDDSGDMGYNPGDDYGDMGYNPGDDYGDMGYTLLHC